MSDTTTANRYDALVKVEREAEAVLAATAANEMGAESASVLKHIESIFERAVHEQVKPLEELISRRTANDPRAVRPLGADQSRGAGPHGRRRARQPAINSHQ